MAAHPNNCTINIPAATLRRWRENIAEFYRKREECKSRLRATTDLPQGGRTPSGWNRR